MKHKHNECKYTYSTLIDIIVHSIGMLNRRHQALLSTPHCPRTVLSLKALIMGHYPSALALEAFLLTLAVPGDLV